MRTVPLALLLSSCAKEPELEELATVPLGPPASITVRINDASLASDVEIVCPDGTREKKALGSQPTVFGGIRVDDCTLYFSGGLPARFNGARRDQDLYCVLMRTEATCAHGSWPKGVQPALVSGSTAPTGPGPLGIQLEDKKAASSAEVQCSDGFRARADFHNGKAVFRDIPASACTLHFKGGTPAKFDDVSGGRWLSCAFVGTTAVCRDIDPNAAPELLGTTALTTAPVVDSGDALVITPDAVIPPPAADEVLVHIAVGNTFSAVEVSCPGGSRMRATVDGQVARVKGVPKADCVLHFKGGNPAQYRTVSGGMELGCDIVGSTAVCTQR